MRGPLRALAILGVVAGLSVLTGGLAATGPRWAQTPSAKPPVDVDLELILAVDVSYSMDPDEQALQREGYILGLTSPEFLNALKQGAHGRIAITYFEWAGIADQKVVVPWRVIDGPETAQAFTDEIARAPYRRAYRTSISGALLFASPLFEGNPYRGGRRVVDVSGDGVNNQGPPVTVIRDELLAEERHRQRPADHAQAAARSQHGYRESRRLLRGLRHRGARLVRGSDQGAREIQGSDPNQAGS